MYNKPWDGKTERRTDATDHDHIIRMLTIQEGMVKTFDSFNTAFVTHTLEDEKKFKELNKSMAMYSGGLIAVNALIGFFLIVRFH